MAGMILILGSSNVDLILPTRRFHDPGETIQGGNTTMVFGGKGANQAIAAKRLGGTVRFLTKLGSDSHGDSYFRYLVQSGVEPKYLLRDKKLPTGLALIQCVPSGENRIIVSPGANSVLSARDVGDPTGLWKEVSIVTTQLETPLPTVEAALRIARRRGVVTILNPAPVVSLSSKILSLVDFLIPNEVEAQQLSGIRMKRKADIPPMAEQLLRRGAKNVILTLGSQGSYFRGEQEDFWMKAFRVKVVDTTAAGDAFVGAFACSLAEGKPIREALRWANGAGALAATRMGAQPSLPSRRDLENFLESQAGDLKKRYKGGRHQVLHDAKADLIAALCEAPHNEDLLERMPIRGKDRSKGDSSA
jgi:ribokinase